MSDVLRGLRIGFLGAGAMAEAILSRLAGSGAELLASDPDPKRRAKMEKEYGVRALEDNRALIAGTPVVILAVKPQVAPVVLQQVGKDLQAGQTVLSIVAGLRLDIIKKAVTPGMRLIRAMPNVPALIGAGIAGVSFPAPDSDAEELARAILGPVGRVVVVSEALLDAVTGLSGSGPAYVALFAEALIEAGVKVGLSREIAAELAVQTLLGSAKLLESGESPHILMERVTSPGGTTAYGLYALERGGLRAAVVEAVTAATERATALGGG